MTGISLPEKHPRSAILLMQSELLANNTSAPGEAQLLFRPHNCVVVLSGLRSKLMSSCEQTLPA